MWTELDGVSHLMVTEGVRFRIVEIPNDKEKYLAILNHNYGKDLVLTAGEHENCKRVCEAVQKNVIELVLPVVPNIDIYFTSVIYLLGNSCCS